MEKTLVFLSEPRVKKVFMSDLRCPLCTVDEIMTHDARYECVTCGHEWSRPDEEPEKRVVKDAFGNVLEAGDIVQMIKDKKLTGSSKVLKSGMKSKPIRIEEEGDHEITCRMDGVSIGLKAMYVKKVNS